MTAADPIPPDGGMTALPDLAALVPVAPGAASSATAARVAGARVVVFAFDTGRGLDEHTAAVPILVQVLDGRLRMRAAGNEVELAPGGLVHIDARVPHSVEALEPSRMALILLDPRPRREPAAS